MIVRLHGRWLQRDGEEYMDGGNLKRDEEHKLHLIIQWKRVKKQVSITRNSINTLHMIRQ